MTDTLVRAAAPVALDAGERAALVDTVRRLLAERCTEQDVRRIMDSESGHDPALWRALLKGGVAQAVLSRRLALGGREPAKHQGPAGA